MSFQHLKRTLAAGGLLALSLMVRNSIYAEHIEVHPSTDESSFSFELKKLTGITFEGKNIVFNLASGDSRVMPMGDVSELCFSENGLSGIESVPEHGYSISVYPNPAVDILYLRIPDSLDLSKCPVALYSIAGNLIWKAGGLADNCLNVSTLQPGMYILSINNSTISFIKK